MATGAVLAVERGEGRHLRRQERSIGLSRPAGHGVATGQGEHRQGRETDDRYAKA
jgi:hypothetical protein